MTGWAEWPDRRGGGQPVPAAPLSPNETKAFWRTPYRETYTNEFQDSVCPCQGAQPFSISCAGLAQQRPAPEAISHLHSAVAPALPPAAALSRAEEIAVTHEPVEFNDMLIVLLALALLGWALVRRFRRRSESRPAAIKQEVES
jgi:hypothetical protein